MIFSLGTALRGKEPKIDSGLTTGISFFSALPKALAATSLATTITRAEPI